MQPDTQAGTDTLVRQWIETPEADRDRMRAQASLTFQNRYDMRKNAVTIVQLFDTEQREREHEA